MKKFFVCLVMLSGCTCRDIKYYKPNYGGRWYYTVGAGCCFPYSTVVLSKEDF